MKFPTPTARRPNLVLFILDIDGTLTDSIPAHQAAFLRALGEIEISTISTEWQTYRHHTDSGVFRDVFRGWFQREPSETESRAFMTRFSEHFACEVAARPFDEIRGARCFLREAKKREVPFAFATGSIRSLAHAKLLLLGIDPGSEILVTADDFISREEIVTAAIERAVQRFGPRCKERVLSVGDGLWDLHTAQNLGIEFFGVGAGERAKELRERGAEKVYRDLLELCSGVFATLS